MSSFWRKSWPSKGHLKAFKGSRIFVHILHLKSWVAPNHLTTCRLRSLAKYTKIHFYKILSGHSLWTLPKKGRLLMVLSVQHGSHYVKKHQKFDQVGSKLRFTGPSPALFYRTRILYSFVKRWRNIYKTKSCQNAYFCFSMAISLGMPHIAIIMFADWKNTASFGWLDFGKDNLKIWTEPFT